MDPGSRTEKTCRQQDGLETANQEKGRTGMAAQKTVQHAAHPQRRGDGKNKVLR
jgi:hypothetical protein